MKQEKLSITSYLKVIICFWLLVVILTGISMESKALPQGGVVTDGSATIVTNPSTPNYMQINQSSNSAVLNWQSFNINSNEHTHFQQPNSSSVAINRINAANGPSNIFGKLTANGNIFLLNPAGVLFGIGSEVNVGGILASTSDLNIDKYRKYGAIELMPNTSYNGQILNQGNINVRDAGFAAFVAPNVENKGTINARLGHVQLSSGEYFTVDLYGDNLINFKIPEADLNPAFKNYSVNQNGALYADGGSITLSAADAGNIVSSVVNFDGIARADTISNQAGRISLNNAKGLVSIGSNSNISAQGLDPNTSGGLVKVSGQDITLAQNSLINVSGTSKGGDVNIGGNYQGKLVDPNDYNAKTVTMEKDATILADATSGNNSENSKGGNIVLWSDDTTNVNGKLSAKDSNTGTDKGKGGSIETSGKINLNIGPDTNVTAGNKGTWLLDPTNITIDDSMASTFNSTLTSGTDVNVTTSSADKDAGDITFNNLNTPITWSTAANFAAIADNGILFNGTNNAAPNLSSTGAGNIYLRTNADGIYDGNNSLFSFNGTSMGKAPYVTSTATGLIEYYLDPLTMGFPSNFRKGAFSAGKNNLIEYQYIYGDSNNLANNDGRGITTVSSITSDLGIGYALNEDINLASSNFAGFGSSNRFTANFDGLNHTISGLTNSTGLEGNFGLFVNAGTGTSTIPQTIKNINIDNATIRALPSSKDITASFATGILIGKAGDGSPGTKLNIDNIHITNSSVTTNDKSNTPLNSIVGGLIGESAIETLNLNNISINNTQVTSSSIAGGLIGKSSALLTKEPTLPIPPSTINLTGDLNLTGLTVNANLLGQIDGKSNTNTYAGGLIGLTASPTLTLNSQANIILSGLNLTSSNKLPGASSFAGGLIGDFSGDTANFSGLDLNATNLLAQIDSTNSSVSSTDPMSAYAGGLFGHANLTNLTFNGPISVNATPTASITATDAASASAYAGGVTGQQQSLNVAYNDKVTTSSAQATTALNNTASTSANIAESYAGGIDGQAQTSTGNFNHNYAANSNISIGTGTPNTKVSASSTGAREIAYAGGMYGLANDTTNTTASDRSNINITGNNAINVNSNINSTIFGNGTATNAADKLNNASASGGLIGGATGVNVNFNNNSPANINGTVATNRTNTATTNSPVQAAGGVIGVFANGDLNFDPNLTNFAVNVASATQNNNTVTNSGYQGGIVGYLDVGENNPSTPGAPGSVNPDAVNNNSDWLRLELNFKDSSACSGPSSELCVRPANSTGGSTGGSNTNPATNGYINTITSTVKNNFVAPLGSLGSTTQNISFIQPGSFVDPFGATTQNLFFDTKIDKINDRDYLELKTFDFNAITNPE
ncbi:MAG: filamentous hemagglutinin N-terminal domain-containing protein [Gammaproteobacteria bacterium]|nr:filamentous hemagglutinin N-terminal domain-containing protein [Gammaproteobacteria bacterium]